MACISHDHKLGEDIETTFDSNSQHQDLSLSISPSASNLTKDDPPKVSPSNNSVEDEGKTERLSSDISLESSDVMCHNNTDISEQCSSVNIDEKNLVSDNLEVKGITKQIDRIKVTNDDAQNKLSVLLANQLASIDEDAAIGNLNVPKTVVKVVKKDQAKQLSRVNSLVEQGSLATVRGSSNIVQTDGERTSSKQEKVIMTH